MTMKIISMMTIIMIIIVFGLQSVSAATSTPSLGDITNETQSAINNASATVNQTAQEVQNTISPIQSILNSINSIMNTITSIIQQVQQIFSGFGG